MNIKYKKFLIILIMIMCAIIQNNTKYKVYSESGYSAKSMIVMDVDSGRVLYNKNINIKSYMASTTKILTAITVIENADVTKEFTVTKQCVGIEGSSIYLQEGEVLTIKDLLYGLMLRSGNDCAVALAIACSESVDAFVNLMNKTANRIGANNSNFTNPHGLHDDNHFTTAYDLALISCYAMKNSLFEEIVSTKSIKIPCTINNSVRVLVNKNKLLKNLDGCNGIKTGYTKKAGRCLVTGCNRNGLRLVCVVLNCGPMWEESSNVLNYCFNAYKKYKIIDKNNIISFVDTDNSNIKCATQVKNDVILPLTESEYQSIEVVYDLPSIINKGTKKDTIVGEIKVFVKNDLIFTEKIYTIVDV